MKARSIWFAAAFGTLVTGAAVLQVQAQQGLAPVELTYSYPGVVPKDVAKIHAALNAYIKPKINATIKLEPIDWGAFDEFMRAVEAGIMIDIFPKKLPIMAPVNGVDENRPYFFNLYVSLQLGKRN